MVSTATVPSLTLGTAQGRVADAGVLVAPKVEKGSAVISVQEYTLVNHSFNNIYTHTHAHTHYFRWKKEWCAVRVSKCLNKERSY